MLKGKTVVLAISGSIAAILCALFAALIAVGAFIKIPVPFVPFTLQLLFTTLAGIVLGPKYGIQLSNGLQYQLSWFVEQVF